MEVLIKLSDAIKTLKSMAVPLVRKLPSAQPEQKIGKFVRWMEKKRNS